MNPILMFELGHGWRRFQSGAVTLWLKDRVDGRDGETLAAELAAASMDAAWLTAWLGGVHGHFALAVEGPGWAFAAVDRIRSTPLFFAADSHPVRLAAHAPSLVAALGLGEADFDADGCLSVALSGYTIGDDTLYRPIRQLRPGEAVLVVGDDCTRLRYHLYRPWLVQPRPYGQLIKELGELTLDILHRMIADADGRTIAVPLSAGLDSRLIASGLVHLDYPKVVCFAYGQPGNAEAHASRRIAQRLGVPWTFVPYTHRGQRRYFKSDLHRRYMDFADSCASSPFMQDLPVLSTLLADGWLPPDSIIVNGNSGDFISGGHVPTAALAADTTVPPDVRWRRLFAAYTKKHLSLWDSLKTPDRLERLERRLRAELDAAGIEFGDPACDHGLYEFLEFQDRQCKYVVSGQRIYDFLDLQWRLPLWDDAYLDFWQGVPVEAKLGQKLYRDMLLAQNWGGVWRDLPANHKWVSPRWIVPLRLACKAAHLPLGASRWHGFDRRFFQYWMSPMCNFAAIPFGRVVGDSRGHRSGISFQNELYLLSKGLDYGGHPV